MPTLSKVPPFDGRAAQTTDLDEFAYKCNVRERVAALIHSGVLNFEKMCQLCEGAFPTLVYEIVRESGEDTIDYRKPSSETWTDLPPPLLLDFDWRFNRGSADYVAQVVSPYEPVLCLGTPTVYHSLVRYGVRATLIDRNPYLCNCLETSGKHTVLCLNVEEADLILDKHIFGSVAMDPPWYLPDYRSWLHAAAFAVRRNGLLVTTVFPRLIRPSAELERHQVLSYLYALGAVLSLPVPVRYATPKYERACLESRRVPVPEEWRTASLVALSCDAELGNDLLHPFKGWPFQLWKRFRIGDEIVALREAPLEKHGDETAARHGYTDETFLLDSVSARDNRRRRINVLTSSNRAAHVAMPWRYGSILEHLEKFGVIPSAESTATSLERESHTMTVGILRELGLEARESI